MLNRRKIKIKFQNDMGERREKTVKLISDHIFGVMYGWLNEFFWYSKVNIPLYYIVLSMLFFPL